MGYLANFMVYTFAMVGIIVVALLVFKNVTQGGNCQKSKYLKVIDTMPLGSRKTLYIVSTGREKFLIAGDIDKTTLISKLETPSEIQILENQENMPTTFRETMSTLAKPDYKNKSNIGIQSSTIPNSKNRLRVMRNLVEKIRK